jgi:hypothetical protein
MLSAFKAERERKGVRWNENVGYGNHDCCLCGCDCMELFHDERGQENERIARETANYEREGASQRKRMSVRYRRLIPQGKMEG